MDGLDYKQVSKNVYYVYTSDDRISMAERLAEEFNGVYDRTPSGQSSIGRVVIGDKKIYIKPKDKPNAGIDNEVKLFQKIREYLEQPIDISFVSDDKEVSFNECESVKLSGTDTANRKKADVVLSSKHRQYNLSLKKDGAQMWESADNYYKTKAENILDKNKHILIHCGTYYKIEPNIAVKATLQEQLDVIFGSDILGSGSVVFRSFSDSDFHFGSNKLKIYCSKIIDQVSEIEPVYFLIRNDKTRKSIRQYPGIRVLAVTESRINKNVKVLDI